MQPTLDQNSNYKTDSGEMDDMSKPSGSLTLNASSISGLSDYQPGDEVMLEVKARMGETDKTGMTTFDIIRVKPEDMDFGAKTNRLRETKVDPTGTNL